jgi:hypothetical protein
METLTNAIAVVGNTTSLELFQHLLSLVPSASRSRYFHPDLDGDPDELLWDREALIDDSLIADTRRLEDMEEGGGGVARGARQGGEFGAKRRCLADDGDKDQRGGIDAFDGGDDDKKDEGSEIKLLQGITTETKKKVGGQESQEGAPVEQDGPSKSRFLAAPPLPSVADGATDGGDGGLPSGLSFDDDNNDDAHGEDYAEDGDTEEEEEEEEEEDGGRFDGDEYVEPLAGEQEEQAAEDEGGGGTETTEAEQDAPLIFVADAPADGDIVRRVFVLDLEDPPASSSDSGGGEDAGEDPIALLSDGSSGLGGELDELGGLGGLGGPAQEGLSLKLMSSSSSSSSSMTSPQPTTGGDGGNKHNKSKAETNAATTPFGCSSSSSSFSSDTTNTYAHNAPALATQEGAGQSGPSGAPLKQSLTSLNAEESNGVPHA